MPKNKRFYLLYDGRAALGDSDNALVLEALGFHGSDRAAIEAANICWGMQDDATLFHYRATGSTGGKLLDEQFLGTLGFLTK